MDLEKLIQAEISQVLSSTDFKWLGEKYEGKVRDSYIQGDTRILVTTDRLSCFDVVVTTVPFKGQVLNKIAVNWFEKTRDIVPNHLLDVPDPNVMVVKNVEILPVEVIIRSYLTGSAWRDYQAGKTISGIKLPEGLRNSEKLPELIVTPSTKAEKGEHDMPISEEDLLAKGLVERKLWQEIKAVALELFKKGQNEAQKNGLILVDTKYEFGLIDGKLVLADEIHTLDSSRYWVAASYRERFEAGEAPEMLDKEPIRQWLLSKGYKGEGEIPEITDQYRMEIARHYIDSYRLITGEEFKPVPGPALERIERALKPYAVAA
ncbi:MAG: phosphoribosylaminoimidazolesuccinocarboxamide synthase [Candidatus Dadabacteria bacterium]|nr:MAG: phosphoribosylaminoimidazolesuccinocarboxamide synthase [Candidatus Dadabacteria bacterium]